MSGGSRRFAQRIYEHERTYWKTSTTIISKDRVLSPWVLKEINREIKEDIKKENLYQLIEII